MNAPRALLLLGALALAACAQDNESPTAPTTAGGAGPMASVTPLSGTWGFKQDMPLSLQDPGVGAVNGKLYVVGGHDTNYAFTDTVLEYTPGTNSWQPVASLPFPIADMAIVPVGSRLYSIGGCDNSFPYDQVIYLKSTGGWASARPIPTPRCNILAGNIGGKIYAFGGYSAGGVPATMGHVYDPSTDRWTSVADIPTFNFGSHAEVLNGKLYVMQQTGGGPTVDVYDPTTDSWSTASQAPFQAAGDYFTSVVKGVLYTVRSNTFGPPVDYGYDLASDSWIQVADNPYIFYNTSAAAIGGTMYMPGGTDGSGNVFSTLITFTPGFAGNHPPVPKFFYPAGIKEGVGAFFDASATTDADGDAITYSWDFGDGTTDTGISLYHAFPDNGTYQVKLHVSDGIGCGSPTKCNYIKTVTVANVKPVFGAALTGGTVHVGQIFVTLGDFEDPGSADTWIGSVDFGDGGTIPPTATTPGNFLIAHIYSTPGTYDMTVTVTDDDGGSRSTVRHVRVLP